MIFCNDLVSIIIILGIIQGILIGIVFLRKSEKSRNANKYLGIILLLFAVHNIDFWASYSRYTLKFPIFLDISVPFTLAMGPLLYGYFYKSIKNRSEKYGILHYIPFAFFFIYSLFFIIQPDEFKFNVFISSRNIDLPYKEYTLRHSFDPLGIRSYTGLFISAQLCIYLTMSYIQFIKHIKEKSLNFFYLNEPIFIWLRNLLLATSVIVITAVVIQLVYPGGRVEFILATWFTIFIYYLSFNLIRGSNFLNQTLFPEKYIKSSLTEKMKNEYRQKVEKLMTDEKLLLDNLFSIKRLSKNSGIPPNHLSQLLNESFHQSFFEFTRYYRIKEAQELLSSAGNAEVNIEEIAHRVGYNSKSAFNKAFLSLTGQTPLSFKKKSMQ